MEFKRNDEFIDIVGHILINDEFNKLKDIEHHGITRFDHSLKVSYYAYKVSKMLKLDYEDTARAALLHDFFLSDEGETFKDKVISTFTHPKKAVIQTKKIFNISVKEENIIHSHMFPTYCALPKFAESWVVIGVDKVVGSFEFLKKFSYKLTYAANLYLIFLLNIKK
jgi:Predicted HD superfamily hydrolase